MLPPSPLLQLVPARLPQALQRIHDQIWSRQAEVTAIAATMPVVRHRPYQEAVRQSLSPVRGPHAWGKLWDQRWFRLQLPSAPTTGDIRYLRWDDQAEATLYVDGQPHYGFDVAHHFAPLPAQARQVWIESVVCQTGIWHPASTGLDPEGSRFSGATLHTRNRLAWQVWHDLAVLDELMREELRAAFPGRESEFNPIGVKPAIGRIPPLLRRLLRYLDDAVNALDTGGLPAARRTLAAAYRELPGHRGSPAAILTGHAHIDLVWLWPERVGEFKTVHTFATAHRLMDTYPEFRFAYSQAASYRAVARRSPRLFSAVRRRIRQGRWEAVGGTEVESDTVLPCGEGLARSFLLGQESFRTLTGNPSPVLWLPDVFGYAGCLPQIMCETGINSFFTTKLTWNAITPFPHSSFVWSGFDGSEVVAHLCQDNGYNQTVTAQELRRGAEAHRQCDVHPEFLAPTGFGDGGGGATEEMCERARRVARLAGVPPTRWGRINDFFRRLHRRRHRLPLYRGELYFELHRGTYTTHGDVKAAFRAFERALQIHEAVHCATAAGPLAPAAWRRLVFAQFHDYIPGSSIHEVYTEGKAEHAALTATALAEARAGLDRTGGSPALFNPLPLPRRHLHAGRLFTLAPLTGAPLAALPSIPAGRVIASARRLSSDRVAASFDPNGRLLALVLDGEPLPFTGPANELWLFPDHPHSFEAWDIDRQTLSCGHADCRRAQVRVNIAETGRGEVAFTRPLGKKSTVTIRYVVESGSPVLGLAYELDWQEEYTLLKAVFPTGFMGRDARYGCPFGSVRRSQTGGPLAAEAMWEVPLSRWCVVPDDSENSGLFLVTEAKYGASCRNGTLGLSLVRSAKITNEDRGQRRGSHPETLRRTLSPHVVSDIGHHRMVLALGRFRPDAPREEQPAALADLLFTRPLAYKGGPVTGGLLGLEGGNSLLPCWAKPEADGAWVLRLHETLGRRGSATIRTAPGWKVRRIALDGRDRGPIKAGLIAFRPYEIVSVRFAPA